MASAGSGGLIYRFAYNSGTQRFSKSPDATSGTAYFFPGMVMTGSSNSGTNGILWAVTVAADSASTKRPATLRALNPLTFAEYWHGNIEDTLGLISKFAPPTVADGKVYVSTVSGSVAVYGLLPTRVSSGVLSVK